MSQIDTDSTAVDRVIRDHLRLVYSAALRQTRDLHMAEDVTQAVFILFLKKRRSIPGEYLAGWLIKATYFTSREALRANRRRHYHEKQAIMKSSDTGSDSSKELAEVLDKGLARLNTRARTAVAMRYLEGRPVGEVAATLGLSENAASKIILRGIDKLRRILGNSHADWAIAPAALMAEMVRVAANGSPSDLTALAAKVGSGQLVQVGHSTALAHAAGKMMVWAKIQVAAMVVCSVAAVAGMGVLGAWQVGRTPAATTPTNPTTGVVIRDFGYLFGSSIELRIPSSTNNNPVSTFISLHGQRIILSPQTLTWNPLAPIPFNSTMDQWLRDNDVDLLIVTNGQKVRIFGFRANYIPSATGPGATSADIVESVVKKTSQWNVTFPETIALPYDFYVHDYSEHFAAAEVSENIKSPGNYLFQYRLIEPDPTWPLDEHLALSDSEFLYARTYSTPNRAGLRITVAGDRLKQLGKTDHYYTGGLFLNGQLLTIGWFDLADRSYTSDIFGTIDTTPQRAQAIAEQLNQATPDNGYKRFLRIYSLGPGQVLRHISPPYPPERKYAMWPVPISTNGLIILNSKNGELVAHQYTAQLQSLPLADMFNDAAGLQNYDFLVDPSLLKIQLAGDFVVDPSAKPEAKLAALQEIISTKTRQKIRITKSMVKRPVIIVMGHYDFTPLPESNHSDAVAITATTTNMTSQEQDSGSDSWQGMLDMIGDYVGVRVIDMVENSPKTVKWANYASTWNTYNATAQTSDPKQLNALLQILAAQTNLDFKIETRDEPTYLINAVP